MYRRYVFRIQIISNCTPLHNLNSWYLEYSSIVSKNVLILVLSHQQHLVHTLKEFGPLFRYVGVGVNATTSLWCAPNQPAETFLKRWSRFTSIQTLWIKRIAWDVKANAPRTQLKKNNNICLFGRNRHPLCRTHHGSYCLISGNSKISRKWSEPQLKISHGSTWSKEETEWLLDIWRRDDEGEGVWPVRNCMKRWYQHNESSPLDIHDGYFHSFSLLLYPAPVLFVQWSYDLCTHVPCWQILGL